MKRKMSGFIEPFTLGILISLIATGALFVSEYQHEKSEHEEPTAQNETRTSTISVTKDPANTELVETASEDYVGAALGGPE